MVNLTSFIRLNGKFPISTLMEARSSPPIFVKLVGVREVANL